jgi:hypothetical protein
MFKQNFVLLSVLVCLFLASGTIFANPVSPDLEVEFLGQNSPFVYSPYTYRVRVENIGGQRADDVNVVIDLPLTDTSPTQHILGNLTGVDSNCQIVANKLVCDLGNIKGGKRKTIRFNFEFPVSTKPLEMKATASNTSGDSNPANDEATKTPNFRYPNNLITSATILNSHCAGQNLTSYFECQLFPSSIQSHSVTLNSDNTISFSQPGYSGSWYQPSSKQLYFSYSDGTNIVAEFNGFAVSSTCFEGLTTFPQNLNYVSPYKVCVQ